MVDYEILESMGTTNKRIRELFTRKMPRNFRSLDKEKQKAIEADIATQQKVKDYIRGRLNEQINFNLTNHFIRSAADLAWDSNPINKSIYPLMAYAQGKLSIQACSTELDKVGCSGFVKKNTAGEAIELNAPAFTQVNFNLGRSIIKRRHAAQANRFNNAWPHYKFEPRSTGLIGKLRADVTSQVIETIVDEFGYRHHDDQLTRDMFLYGHVVDFPRSSWEIEMRKVKKKSAPGLESKKVLTESEVAREGITWTNPHPSRVGWDNMYPLPEINSDSGPTFIFYWDVMRYGDIRNNPDYFNRTSVSGASTLAGYFATYASYFSQYYTTIKPPVIEQDLADGNDRVNNIGLYTPDMDESSVMYSNFFWKIIPKDYGIGEYPYPVWMRLVIAGDDTVIYGEVMPSRPGAVWSFNENDGRLVNISEMHELMGYQDQMTNLQSQLLMVLKAESTKVMIVNTDILEGEVRKKFTDTMQDKTFYAGVHVLEVSFEKMREAGIDITKVIHMQETPASDAVGMLMRAMMHLLAMVDRLMALSPQEMGQPAARETTATETNLISTTTQSIYDWISDSINQGRAAKKRILYESLIAKGKKKYRVPVKHRYTEKTIKAAGFEVVEEEREDFVDPSQTARQTIIGTVDLLEHDYIFSSRDGAERSVNTQAANTLVQLLALLNDPDVKAAIGKEKYFQILNEAYRLSGAGVDLNAHVKEGEDNNFGVGQNEQVISAIQQLAEQLKQSSMTIQELQQQLEQVGTDQQQLTALVGQLSKAVHKDVQNFDTHQQDHKVSESLNYKDAPPDVRRQMELQAGMVPSRMPEPIAV